MVENRFSRSRRHVLMTWMNSLWGNACSDLGGWARGGGRRREGIKGEVPQTVPHGVAEHTIYSTQYTVHCIQWAVHTVSDSNRNRHCSECQVPGQVLIGVDRDFEVLARGVARHGGQLQSVRNAHTRPSRARLRPREYHRRCVGQVPKLVSPALGDRNSPVVISTEPGALLYNITQLSLRPK